MPSANFYNNGSWMIGVDLHHAWVPPTSISEAVTGHRVEDIPHVVGSKHSWKNGDPTKRAHTVTACGEKMIRDGFTFSKVPHVTVILWPYELVELAKITASGKSEPFVKIATVTSMGDPLVVCAIVSVGFNLNCWDEGTKLSGLVGSPISVKTKAQLKDVLFRIFDDFFKKGLVKWLTKLVDKLLEARKIPWPIRPILVWLAQKLIAQLVELAEWVLKQLWDLAEEQTKDPDPVFPKPNFPEVPALPEAQARILGAS
jgi:hypothetical protein